jgi:hypothetical protein
MCTVFLNIGRFNKIIMLYNDVVNLFHYAMQRTTGYSISYRRKVSRAQYIYLLLDKNKSHPQGKDHVASQIRL